ncbi:lipin Ned1 [Sorochytrium milnesiophthora]
MAAQANVQQSRRASRVNAVLNKVATLYKDIKEINPSTLSGAIDVIVVEGVDKELVCSPFHVRFGKLHVFRAFEKVVNVTINDQPAHVDMLVDEDGQAFFASESESEATLSAELVTSPSLSHSPATSANSTVPPPAPDAKVGATEEAPAASHAHGDGSFGAKGDPVKQELTTHIPHQVVADFQDAVQGVAHSSQKVSVDEFVQPVLAKAAEHSDLLPSSSADGPPLAASAAHSAISSMMSSPTASHNELSIDTPAPPSIASSTEPTPPAGLPTRVARSESELAALLPNPYTDNSSKRFHLSSQQLKKLNLKKGVNTVTFSVTTRMQGRATCTARIFFWDESVNIVISDIDGTITKSDALGQLLTMAGRDWTQLGVAGLYTLINSNGYQIVYLTSRAIGQAHATRSEVIQRRPEVFKIACLKQIRSLFKERNPFHAGFGNRHTDAVSYNAVGISPSRIFTINPVGELKLELLEDYKTSYVLLQDMVDHIFPPVTDHIDPEFNDFEYWRVAMADVPEDQVDATIAKDAPQADSKPSNHRSWGNWRAALAKHAKSKRIV